MRQNGAKAWWSKVRGRLMARAGQAQGVWGMQVAGGGGGGGRAAKNHTARPTRPLGT